MSSDRRSVLKIFGAIGATCTYPFSSDELYGQDAPLAHEHALLPPQPASWQPRFFNQSDFAAIERIADLIIPATETPGAVAAGVPAYIDLVIARNTDEQVLMADGLRWLDAEAHKLNRKTFTELSEAQQLSLLEPLCEAADAPDDRPKGRNVQFFAALKRLTADGYYTSRAGLIEELGYRGNTARTSFPICSNER